MAVIKANKREGTGKYVAFDLRKEGQVPGVMYGMGVENANISLDAREIKDLVHSGERLVHVEVEGKKVMAVLKAVQHSNIGDDILHADFRVVNEKTPIHVEVPIELKGDAKGVAAGGVLEQEMHMVQIECLPGNLPEGIMVNVAELGVGEVWYVKDLPAVDGVTYMGSQDVAVVSCHVHGAGAEEEEAEEAEAAAE